MLELGMVSSFHPHSMCKSVERVTAKTGCTSCTNWTISLGVSGFRTRTHLLHGHFNVFILIRTPDFFCVQYASFKATSPISNMFWHHLLFFSHLPICLGSYMTVKLKITTKWTLKMLELGMVSSFHPHSMCKRVERVTAKTGRTSCTNWTVSFGVSGFRTRTHLLHWHFIFLNLLQLQTFFAFRTHHSKQCHQFTKLCDVLCYF